MAEPRAELPVIDPTKNVLDLVAAQAKYRDELREADNKYQDAMRDAETRRINELRAQDERYGTVMDLMRDAKIDSSAKLLADQLREIKNDIQVELRSLNQFRWESGGKSAGGSMVTYIIVQAVLTFAGIVAIIGTLVAVFKH
jgi:hypothetical protein